MIKKSIWLIIANLALYFTMLLAMLFCINKIEWYMQCLGYCCFTVFSCGSILAAAYQKQAVARSLFVFNVLTFVVIGSLTILHLCGLFDDFSDMHKLKALILATGGWAYVVYIFLQLLNVVILPLPGFVFILAGLAIFGPVQTFFITYAVFVIGSIMCFFIGRFFGQKALLWCVGAENTQKYSNYLGNRGHLLFFMMQVLPFFPDDILCVVAGLTNMKLPFFVFTMLVAKPLYVGAVCFLGTGSIIPFSGWGVPVWIAITLFLVAVFALFCKYQTKLEHWFAKLTHKR